MNNWRLLLLAVVVVVQPIGSFTESNLIDGRECCERRSTQDERLYGYRRTENRRQSLVEIREKRRYESYPGPVLSRSEWQSFERNERRVSPELTSRAIIANRFSGHQDRYLATPELRQTRETSDDERNARESRNRATLEATRTIKLSKDVVRYTRFVPERESKTVMSRLPIRARRSVENRRISPNREESKTIFKREREDIVRLDTKRERQSASRSEIIQFDNNRERRVIGMRKDGNEIRFSRPSIARVNEIRAVREQKSVEKNEGDSHRYKDVEFKQQRENELRVTSVRRNFERVSAIRMRGPRADVRNRLDVRNTERIAERRRYEKTDTLQRFAEHQLDSPQSRSRSLEMASQGERIHIRKPFSMDRISVLRENRDALSRNSGRNSPNRGNRVQDSTERQETRRNVRSSRTDMNFRNQLDSRIRNDIRNNEESYFRSQGHGNERGINLGERTIRLVHDSTSAKLREVLSVSSGPSRAARSLQETRNNRIVDSRRQTRDQNRANKRTSVQREVRYAHQPIETSRPSSFESVRLERAVRNCDDIRQNRDQERSIARPFAREIRNIATPQRLDIRRTISKENERLDSPRKERGDERVSRYRRSRERVLVERRQENRENKGHSQNVRDEAKNRETRMYERMYSRLQQDDSIDRVFTERKAVRDLQNVRTAVTRREVGMDEKMGSRLRDVTRRTNARALATSRQESRDSMRDSRNARAVTRREVRMDKRMDSRRDIGSRTNERKLAERRQENRETERYSRTVRNEARNHEIRMDSRRDASKESRTLLLRESRDGTERLIENNEDYTSSQTEGEARNIETEVRFIRRNMRSDNVLQKSKIDVQSNDFMLIEHNERRVSNIRDKHDDSRFRNVDSLAFRDTMGQEKSGEPVFSWPMIFYTLQGIYLFGLLVQILNESAYKTKKRNNWWPSKNLVKVD